MCIRKINNFDKLKNVPELSEFKDINSLLSRQTEIFRKFSNQYAKILPDFIKNLKKIPTNKIHNVKNFEKYVNCWENFLICFNELNKAENDINLQEDYELPLYNVFGELNKFINNYQSFLLTNETVMKLHIKLMETNTKAIYKK